MALYRPTWVEVDLGSIEHNTIHLTRLAQSKGLRLIAVVKADGYGHGAVLSSRAVLDGGAAMLAVATPEEGIVLRENGISAPILVMGAYCVHTAEVYWQYDLSATLADAKEIASLTREAQRAGKRVRVQLKIDTGMGRIGVAPREAVALMHKAWHDPSLHVEGVYSHLACGEQREKSQAQQQIMLFDELLVQLDDAGMTPQYRHILNSSGLMQHDHGRTNMARVGLVLYGEYPAPHLEDVVDLRAVLTWKSQVATVKPVPAGTGVSYGHAYHTSQATHLVTIPVGYADGVKRVLSGRAHVLIRGRRHHIAGSICMDQTIIDVGDHAPTPGEEVVLIGRQGNEQISIGDWARWADTIGYEIISTISHRVPRQYIVKNGGQSPR